MADAHEFVMQCEDSFDIILVDINYIGDDDPTISPPWKYLSKEFLNKLISMTNGKEFYLAINTICYDKEAQEKLVKALKMDEYLVTHQGNVGFSERH